MYDNRVGRSAKYPMVERFVDLGGQVPSRRWLLDELDPFVERAVVGDEVVGVARLEQAF